MKIKNLPYPSFDKINKYEIEGKKIILEFFPKKKAEKEKKIKADMWKITVEGNDKFEIYVPSKDWREGIMEAVKHSKER